MSGTEDTADLPALTSLLVAFQRWQKEEDFVEDWNERIESAKRTLGIHIPQPDPVPPPAALAFVARLPLIDLADLPKNRQDCEICGEKFHSLQENWKDPRDECAARLPCGQLIGRYCLAAWIDPYDERNNNTCPYCRRELFDKLPDQGTLSGLQARVAMYDWINQKMVGPPPPGQREYLREVTEQIVWVEIEDAYFEHFGHFIRLKQRLLEEGWSEEQMTPPGPNVPYEVTKLQISKSIIDDIDRQMQDAYIKRHIEAGTAQMDSGDAAIRWSQLVMLRVTLRSEDRFRAAFH